MFEPTERLRNVAEDDTMKQKGCETMDISLWLRLLIVLAIGAIWIGFLIVLRQVLKRKILEAKVMKEVHHIAEAHAVDPTRLETFLELFYGDAFNRDCGVIAFGCDGMPDRRGTIRLRLDLEPSEAESSVRLRIVPLGLKSMRRVVFEPMDSVRGWMDFLSIQVQKRNL
jgi:hypothetical protein